MSDAAGTGEEDDARRYGTLEGVFVPTLLTIIGVILFLRTGWVVGNAGWLGALGIIVLAFAITGLTALSLSSISTNVTPGPGGAYSVVARSFGVEAGGAVGICLYLSQSLVIVLYLFGFRDGWLRIFPEHPAMVVDLLAVLGIVGIVLVGTRIAFRVQYLILAVVTVALGAIAWAAATEPLDQTPALLGSFPGAPEEGFPGTNVWVVFAVFFPATTGIMAGLNLSGELRDARRSILRGTLGAVGVSAVVYLAVALWLAFAVPTEELVGDYLVLAERSAWPPAVLAGLLAATFSSALASLVGAPRILQALAVDRVTPAPGWLERRSGRGEPRNALVVTIVVVAAGVLLRDLNAIASLITLVFLLTYGAINLAVLAEHVADLPSYRPTFRVHWLVPLLGSLGCLGAMLAIDPWAALGALVLVVVALIWLARRDVPRPGTDIRSALLRSIGRAAIRTARRTESSVAARSWSPRFLAPVGTAGDLDLARRWLQELGEEGERVRFVPFRGAADEGVTGDARDEAIGALTDAGLEVSMVDEEVESADGRGPVAVLVASSDEEGPGAVDVVLARFPEGREHDRGIHTLLREAFDADAGVILLPPGPPQVPTDDASERTIALWVRGNPPTWRLDDHLPGSDLALLVAYRLQRQWDTSLTLVTALGRRGSRDDAEAYLERVGERARLPGPPRVRVVERSFADALEEGEPEADLHVLALSSQTDLAWLREVRDRLDAPCLFVRDSGIESAFA